MCSKDVTNIRELITGMSKLWIESNVLTNAFWIYVNEIIHYSIYVVFIWQEYKSHDLT